MKFIDLDNAGLRSAIGKTVQLGQSGTGDCLKHSDCNYFDCKGICNLVTGDSQQNFNKIPQTIWNSFSSVFILFQMAWCASLIGFYLFFRPLRE